MRYGVAVLLLFIGVGLRLIPHVPNFAPIGAIALFGGALLRWRLAIWLPLAIMITSDAVLGFYPGIIYTWTAFLLVTTWGMLFQKRHFLSRITIGALGSSIIFFVVSNLGVWVASGMYAHSIAGLLQCYAMALPFFKMTLLSDMLYSAALFGAYEGVRYMIVRAIELKNNNNHIVTD